MSLICDGKKSERGKKRARKRTKERGKTGIKTQKTMKKMDSHIPHTQTVSETKLPAESSNNVTIKYNLLDQKQENPLSQFEKEDPYNSGVLPEFKTKILEYDMLNMYGKRRMRIGELYSRPRNGVKKDEIDAKYFGLLAMEEILEEELTTNEYSNCSFKSKHEVLKKYKEIQAKLNSIRIMHYAPVLKEELIQNFNAAVTERFNRGMKGKEDKDRIPVLFDVVWRVLETYLEDPNCFEYPITKKDREFWCESGYREFIIRAHMSMIYPDTYTSFFLPAQAAVLTEMNKTLNTFDAKMKTINNNIIIQSKAMAAAKTQKQQVSERVREGQKEERREKAKEKRTEDETKPNNQRVEEYIRGHYVEDAASFITSQALHSAYKEWMDLVYPGEPKIEPLRRFGAAITDTINGDKHLCKKSGPSRLSGYKLKLVLSE